MTVLRFFELNGNQMLIDWADENSISDMTDAWNRAPYNHLIFIATRPAVFSHAQEMECFSRGKFAAGPSHVFESPKSQYEKQQIADRLRTYKPDFLKHESLMAEAMADAMAKGVRKNK